MHFAKLFVEDVVILAVIILRIKSLYPNIDTKQKKFKNISNFFYIIRHNLPDSKYWSTLSQLGNCSDPNLIHSPANSLVPFFPRSSIR